MVDFDTAFNRLIDIEGGYTNDPKDPGGETKFGISKRSYPNLIISKLTREDAYNIYKRDFWNRISSVPNSVAYQLFDFAINSGIETAIRYLQRAVNVADDGHIGPVTLEAIKSTSECDILLRLNGERLDYMTRLSTWDRFGKGWARRIANNLIYCSKDNGD